MLRSIRVTALALVASLGISTAFAGKAQAQNTEERFQDLFVTAGYTTAFGAALGTAFLAFTPNPAENLRYVAVGASLGFIGGSIMGSYIIFSPMISEDGETGRTYSGSLASERLLPSRGMVVRPTFDRESHHLVAVEGGLALAQW